MTMKQKLELHAEIVQANKEHMEQFLKDLESGSHTTKNEH